MNKIKIGDIIRYNFDDGSYLDGYVYEINTSFADIRIFNPLFDNSFTIYFDDKIEHKKWKILSS